MNEIKLRDLRIKEKYHIDDEYLNGYAKICGWKSTLVYNSLCRHADKDQYSFPSIDHMAEQHGISPRTIIRGIQLLEEYNIIQVVRERNPDGTNKNNGYILIDKSEWKKKPVSLQSPGQPSDSQSPGQPRSQVTDVQHKDTHIIKDTHIQKEKLDKPENHSEFLTNLPLPFVQALSEKFQVHESDIRKMAEAAHDWCLSKGKMQKNYLAFLRNWIRKNQEYKQASKKTNGPITDF